MLAKVFHSGRVAVGAVLLATACLAVLGSQESARATSPHPGLQFSIGVDTNGDSADDCGTGPGDNTNCVLAPGETFTLNAYLDDLGTLAAYGAFDLYIEYSGVDSKGNPDSSPWPDCVYDVSHTSTPGFVAWGCVRGVAPAPDSTYTGLLGTTDFNCTSNGTITMVHGGDLPETVGEPQRTFLAQPAVEGSVLYHNHAEGQLTSEALTIDCAAGPVGGIALDITEGSSRNLLPSLTLLGGALAAAALVSVAWLSRRRRAGRSV